MVTLTWVQLIMGLGAIWLIASHYGRGKESENTHTTRVYIDAEKATRSLAALEERMDRLTEKAIRYNEIVSGQK